MTADVEDDTYWCGEIGCCEVCDECHCWPPADYYDNKEDS